MLGYAEMLQFVTHLVHCMPPENIQCMTRLPPLTQQREGTHLGICVICDPGPGELGEHEVYNHCRLCRSRDIEEDVIGQATFTSEEYGQFSTVY